MTKALKHAHSHLGNHQLVAQVSIYVFIYKHVTSLLQSLSEPSLLWFDTNTAGNTRFVVAGNLLCPWIVAAGVQWYMPNISLEQSVCLQGADNGSAAWLNMLGVLQVLNVLAPAQLQRGDTMGAQSMLQSSFTLTRGLHDLPTMLSALQGISEYHAQAGETEKFDANAQYAASKHAAYVQAMQDAVQTAEHSKIMQWQGFS